jgi:RimJ/RimL family protein N-acetyltransferase
MNDWQASPDLVGDHVRLRAMEAADKPALLEAFADNPPLPVTFVPDAASIDAWFERLMEEKAVGRAFPYTVFDADGRVSGTTRYLRMSAAHRRLEIGGTIYARRVQRTALNTEAKFLLLRQAFEAMGCNVVQLRTDVLNARSRAAIERLGATRDGTLRAHMVMTDGRVRDTAVYSIVAGEWPAVRARLEGLMRR